MMRAAFLGLLFGCTTLGPMPATTGIPAVPVGRPGVEAQIGTVPGFYASQSAQNEAKGTTFGAGSLLLEPDRWLPVKGLLVGARVFGPDGDRPFEPYLGYRRRLPGGVSLGVIGFGSSKRAERYASYHGVRVGGEAMVEVELWAPSDRFRVHAQAATALTHILMSGVYCVDGAGVGKDCDEDPTLNTVITGKVEGMFPSATAQLVLDGGRRQGTFDSARLALLFSAGRMPLVLGGADNGGGTYTALGFSLTVAFGVGRAANAE